MARQHADKSDTQTSARHGANAKTRKDRIDDALKAFETKSNPSQGVVSPEGGAQTTEPSHAKPDTAHSVTHEPNTHPKSETPSEPPADKATEREFILSHANEALDVLKRKKPKAPANEVTAETIAPTNPDPESAIMVAAAERERERAEAEAAAKAKKFDVTPVQFQERKLNRRLFVVLACLWLAAVPAAMILYGVAYSEDGVSSAVVGRLVTLITFMLGTYGLLGWIPLMVLYMRRRNT
ncbi:hypothetical protein KDA14_00450 [Candidatus Saccharibacteria bacterium]|nr:hypothetical protein [Candidatus Saccharibacteria bacterium]